MNYVFSWSVDTVSVVLTPGTSRFAVLFFFLHMPSQSDGHLFQSSATNMNAHKLRVKVEGVRVGLTSYNPLAPTPFLLLFTELECGKKSIEHKENQQQKRQLGHDFL
jgi:hypothetical protein